MIHVVATIELVEGRREEFLTVVRANLPNVLAEAGCFEYVPAIDLGKSIAAQPPPRANVVTVIEKWKDLDALRAHLAAPHMVEYREKVKGMVRTATIHVLTPVG